MNDDAERKYEAACRPCHDLDLCSTTQRPAKRANVCQNLLLHIYVYLNFVFPSQKRVLQHLDPAASEPRPIAFSSTARQFRSQHVHNSSQRQYHLSPWRFLTSVFHTEPSPTRAIERGARCSQRSRDANIVARTCVFTSLSLVLFTQHGNGNRIDPIIQPSI